MGATTILFRNDIRIQQADMDPIRRRRQPVGKSRPARAGRPECQAVFHVQATPGGFLSLDVGT